MVYRNPDDPVEKLPDIVGASRRRAALGLGAVGMGSLVLGAILLLTSVIFFAQIAGCISITLGLVLLAMALVFALRREG